MYWKETAHQTVTNMSYQKITTTMNTVPTTTTNPADSQNNHSACAGKRDWGFEHPENDPVDHFQRRAGRQAPGVPQQAKCKRCYLCPACYYAPGLVSREHGTAFPKKNFHFVKTFGLGNPVKPSFQKNKHTKKCQQSLTPQRFPKFSKRENDFEGRVIW